MVVEVGFEEKAQVSAELLIVIAAVVAVAMILVSGLLNTGQQGAERMNRTVEKTFNRIDETLNSTG